MSLCVHDSKHEPTCARCSVTELFLHISFFYYFYSSSCILCTYFFGGRALVSPICDRNLAEAQIEIKLYEPKGIAVRAKHFPLSSDFPLCFPFIRHNYTLILLCILIYRGFPVYTSFGQ